MSVLVSIKMIGLDSTSVSHGLWKEAVNGS